MDRSLDQLEQIQEQLLAEGELDGALLQSLLSQWETAVAIILEKGSGPLSEACKQTCRERLEVVLGRLPAIQDRLAREKSQVAKQLMQESQRFNALKQGYAGQGQKVSMRLLDHEA
jgi:hypothetical protein